MRRLDTLSVAYPGKRGAVLAPASVEVASGTFGCILGRNGAGKSMLMRTPALGGQSLLDDEPNAAMRPATRARRIAVVLTESTFSPGLTVDDVVSLGRQPFMSWQGHLTADDHR